MSLGKNDEKGYPQEAITLLLQQGGGGDPAIQERLYHMLYAQLRVMAAGRIRNERAGITLQATDLVHEAWLKLIGQHSRSRGAVGGAKVQTFESRQHFFSAASNAMRQVLIDAARARQRQKRGGGTRPVSLQDHEAITNDDHQLFALDEALGLLRGEDPIKAELVTLRYFGGLTNAQVAEQLGISTATAERYWAFARAWLKDRMSYAFGANRTAGTGASAISGIELPLAMEQQSASSVCLSIGLVKYSLQPAFKHFWRSPSIACAVSATMGSVNPSSRSRMVAEYPSISGICMSIRRISGNAAPVAAACVMVSTAMRPLSATITVAPAFLR